MINRVLLWKELRMQRPVLLVGLACAAFGPLVVLALVSTQGAYRSWGIGPGLRTMLAVAWPFVAVTAGAITIATEDEDGTARFLLSRPVSRARIWGVKVGAAAITLAATGLSWFIAMAVVDAVVEPLPADFVVRAGDSDWTLFVSSTVFGLGLLFFGCGVLCSTVIGRPLTAAAAAVTVSMAAMSLVFLLWSVLGLAPHLEPQWLGAELIVLSALLGAMSLLVYSWPEQFGRGAARGVVGDAGVAAAITLLLVVIVMPTAFAAMTPRVDELDAIPGSISYGPQVVAMAMRNDAGTTQNWLLMTDGSGARPITGRHTLAPRLGSTGRDYVAYYARRGVFGTAGGTLDLRITSVAGTASWTVFRGMPGVRELFFYEVGPNGKVAFAGDGEIVVAHLNGYGHQAVPTAGTPLEGATLLALGTATSAFAFPDLLMASGDVDLASATLRRDGALFAYDVESATTRELVRLAAGSVLPAMLRNPSPGADTARGGDSWARAHVPLLAVEPRAGGGAGARLVRLVISNGDVQPVHEITTAWTDEAGRAAFHRCAAVERAADRRWTSDGPSYRSFVEDQVLLGDCSAQTRAELGTGVVRLVGVRSGDVVTWPLPPDGHGTVNRIWLSQRQDTVLVDMRGATSADSYAVTLDLDGNTRIYPDGWIPLGWTTPDYFLLQREQNGAVTFAVGDARNGEIYDLFPENELREVLEQRRLEQQALVGVAR